MFTRYKKSINRVSLRLAALAIAMFGFGYALVPLYDLICDVTGLNGKVELVSSSYNPANQDIDYKRSIHTRFVTVYNESIPWKLTASKSDLLIHPGKVYQLDYTVENISDKPMTAQAIPSVSPSNVADNVKKIQCFCFDNIHLEAGETLHTSVVFFLDQEVEDTIKNLTLSYTLFDVSSYL